MFCQWVREVELCHLPVCHGPEGVQRWEKGEKVVKERQGRKMKASLGSNANACTRCCKPIWMYSKNSLTSEITQEIRWGKSWRRWSWTTWPHRRLYSNKVTNLTTSTWFWAENLSNYGPWATTKQSHPHLIWIAPSPKTPAKAQASPHKMNVRANLRIKQQRLIMPSTETLKR